MPRSFTEEEVREVFLNQLRVLIQYWHNVKGQSEEEKMDGLVFSILNIFDGSTMNLPALDIVLSPHPEDEQYHKDNGQNWFQAGMVINDCMLHEHWCRKEKGDVVK